MAKVPLLIVGDSPTGPSGLARIARDLTNRLWENQEELNLDIAFLGLNYDNMPMPWRVYPLKYDEQNSFGAWGGRELPHAWAWHSRGRPGVVFTVWDPARCYSMISHNRLPSTAKKWGYFAIDAANRKGSLSGFAAETVRAYDRVLGYGKWGAQVLRTVRETPVPWLPHGLDMANWKRPVGSFPEGTSGLVGCVATNQPRKNLALLFEVWEKLSQWDPQLKFWLHTDSEMTTHWSVPQLAEDFGLNGDMLLCTGGEGAMQDSDLAQLYASCSCTIAPSLGEGFGYPIVESLAAGVPVIHGDFAGGSELLPLRAWRIPPVATRTEGALNSIRPVFDAEPFFEASKAAIEWKRRDPLACAAYCRGAVAHLDWDMLWGRWLGWFREGLREFQC